MSGPEDRLDRRFVVTAALLAAVYAFLVAIIAATIGLRIVPIFMRIIAVLILAQELIAASRP
jgi:hypothetical protein